MNITYMKDEELEMIAGGFSNAYEDPRKKGKGSVVIHLNIKTDNVMIKFMAKAKGTGVELLGRLLGSILGGHMDYPTSYENGVVLTTKR